MTTRTSQTTTGTQAQRGIVPQLQNEIQSLQVQFSELERRVFGTGGGGGNGRQGTAGGIRARRATTGAVGGNAGGAGAGTNREWIMRLLKQHGEGLTAPQIKALATKSGRHVYVNYPSDVLSKMRNEGLIRTNGGVFTLATAGGTGPVARSGTSRTRTKKPIARTMTAAG